MFTLFLSYIFRARFPLNKFSVDRVYYTLGVFAVVFFAIASEHKRYLTTTHYHNLFSTSSLRVAIKEIEIAERISETISTCPGCFVESFNRTIQSWSTSPVWASRLLALHCDDFSSFEGVLQEAHGVQFDAGNEDALEEMRLECENIYSYNIQTNGWPTIDSADELFENLAMLLPLHLEEFVSTDTYLSYFRNLTFGEYMYILVDSRGQIRNAEDIALDINFLFEELSRIKEEIIIDPTQSAGGEEKGYLVDLLRLNIWPFIVITMIGLKLARSES